jgi:hypothetical protein
MSYHLTVNQPFGDYKRGDHITDAAVIAKVVKTHPQHVVKRFPKPEHESGAFYLSDTQIAERAKLANPAVPE